MWKLDKYGSYAWTVFDNKDIRRDGQYWVMPNGDRYFDDGTDAGFMVCLLVDVANGVTDASVHPCLWRVQA